MPESFTIKQQSALKSQYGTLKLTTTVEQTREAAESVLPVIADCALRGIEDIAGFYAIQLSAASVAGSSA